MSNTNEHEIKKDFLKEWPISRLESLSLEEYTNLDKTSFCYWIESITTNLGSIWGGSAFKFGIFKRNNTENQVEGHRKTDGEYSWLDKYGETKEEAFERIKSLVISIAKNAKENKLELIDSIDIGNAVKWKIAHLYSDYNVLNIYRKDALVKLLERYKYEGNFSFSNSHRYLSSLEHTDEDFYSFTKRLWNESETNIDQSVEDKNKIIFQPLNQILYGPPGTGKTYNTINKALEIIEGKEPSEEERKNGVAKKRFDEYVENGQVVFTTFHQSMSYEDFVEGIKPKTNDENEIYYKVEAGIFKNICSKSKGYKSNFEEVLELLKQEVSEVDGKDPLLIKGKNTHFDVKYKGTHVFYIHPRATSKGKDAWYPVNIDNIRTYFETGDATGVYNPTYVKGIIDFLSKERGLQRKVSSPNKKHVLIIDEINRGNVSAIFGELITLLEESKRLGNKEELKVKLPYSKETFGVPNNLYIIGTMNTADRSVEALDTALRRRFVFKEMMPKPDLLEYKEEVGIDLQLVLETINERIKVLLDRDHQIGHSYFIKVNSFEELKRAFSVEIIPLLQEYFYGDYIKIALVLGLGFFEEPKSIRPNLFAKINGAEGFDYTNQTIYELRDPLKMKDDEFKKAIGLLLEE